MMAEYISKGGLILTITQCRKGTVAFGKYETSRMFMRLGVINGFDMTCETALTKMMYVLGRYRENEERKQALEKNSCGEFTLS